MRSGAGNCVPNCVEGGFPGVSYHGASRDGVTGMTSLTSNAYPEMNLVKKKAKHDAAGCCDRGSVKRSYRDEAIRDLDVVITGNWTWT